MTKKQKIARLKWAIKKAENEYEQNLLMQELYELKEEEE